jgi:hypothetical protein
VLKSGHSRRRTRVRRCSAVGVTRRRLAALVNSFGRGLPLPAYRASSTPRGPRSSKGTASTTTGGGHARACRTDKVQVYALTERHATTAIAGHRRHSFGHARSRTSSRCEAMKYSAIYCLASNPWWAGHRISRATSSPHSPAARPPRRGPRRRCPPPAVTRWLMSTTEELDPQTTHGRGFRSGPRCERLARGSSRAWFGRDPRVRQRRIGTAVPPASEGMR